MSSYKLSKIILLFCIVVSAFSSHLYFDAPVKRPKCFIEELFEKNMAMIKYTINGLEGNDVDNAGVLANFNIKITHEPSVNEPALIDQSLTTKDGKISLTAPRSGQYRICVTFYKGYWANKYQTLTVSLQILSDNMDEPNLNDAVKSDDVEKIREVVNYIVRKGDQYISHQNELKDIEDSDSKNIMKAQNIYFNITVFQIVVVITMGVYQILNFKRYINGI